MQTKDSEHENLPPAQPNMAQKFFVSPPIPSCDDVGLHSSTLVLPLLQQSPSLLQIF